MGIKIESIDQATNVEINGTTYNLVSISGTEDLETIKATEMTREPQISSLSVGQHIVAIVAGDMRHGIISKVGRRNVTVMFITASAISQIERLGYGTLGRSNVSTRYVWA